MKMKSILSILLAAVFLLSFAGSSFAAGGEKGEKRGIIWPCIIKASLRGARPLTLSLRGTKSRSNLRDSAISVFQT